MKPEDLSPQQLLQLAALGFIFISLLVASFASWGILFYRLNRDWGFNLRLNPRHPWALSIV